MAVRIDIIRHGQSEANLARVFDGAYNMPLTPLGLRQAECTAAFLADRPLSAVYASDLKRAFVTGETIAAAHGLHAFPAPEFREVNGGEWDGHTYDDLEQNDADRYSLWLSDWARCRCPGGESMEDVLRRAMAGLERLAEKHNGQEIAVATHGGPIRIVLGYLKGYPMDRMSELSTYVSNASVTVLEKDDAGEWHIIAEGLDEHLGDMKTVLPKNV